MIFNKNLDSKSAIYMCNSIYAYFGNQNKKNKKKNLSFLPFYQTTNRVSCVVPFAILGLVECSFSASLQRHLPRYFPDCRWSYWLTECDWSSPFSSPWWTGNYLNDACFSEWTQFFGFFCGGRHQNPIQNCSAYVFEKPVFLRLVLVLGHPGKLWKSSYSLSYWYSEHPDIYIYRNTISEQ